MYILYNILISKHSLYYNVELKYLFINMIKFNILYEFIH